MNIPTFSGIKLQACICKKKKKKKRVPPVSYHIASVLLNYYSQCKILSDNLHVEMLSVRWQIKVLKISRTALDGFTSFFFAEPLPSVYRFFYGLFGKALLRGKVKLNERVVDRVTWLYIFCYFHPKIKAKQFVSRKTTKSQRFSYS